jgi:hypothetical protein
MISSAAAAQNRLTHVRVAYGALSAGIGTLWLTHEDGYLRTAILGSTALIPT